VPAPFAAADAGATAEPARLGAATLQGLDSATSLDGIATFPGRVPTAQDRANLESLGLQVQLMRNLPMALVRGPATAMLAAVDRGYAFDVYPDEELEYHDLDSSRAMGAHLVWEELGFDGTGVGVAIMDTGIDATHPDLEDRVTHNVKIVGSEYAPGHNTEFSLVIPVEEGPYNNSDNSGHGTHVAGIVAADGSGDETHVGVAPGADLIGYSIGDVALVFTAVTAFDHMLEVHEEWNIRVNNNSWGTSFRHFDPLHPINLATKALYDAGIVTVFSAGNSRNEMQLNPYSTAPWVISSGSTTIAVERSPFSSRGLKYDNAPMVELPEDGYMRFVGDRIGIYHPNVSAPGSNIRSAGTPTGTWVGPTPPGGTRSASGTSMSAPHIAGLAALLLEANPDLTPDQVTQVLQITADRMRDGSAFWESGYGFVDAVAAVELATSRQVRNAPGPTLDRLQRDVDRQIQAARDHRVLVTDHWFFTAQPASIGGADTRELTFEVTEQTEALRATAAFAASLGLVGINDFAWGLTLKDAEGTVVAESETAGDAGLTWFHVDLAELEEDPVFGEWTLEVSGDLNVSEGNWWHNRVSVAIAQLEKQDAVPLPEPTFHPQEEITFFFTGDPDAGETNGSEAVAAGQAQVVPSPEGCAWTQDVVAGGAMVTADLADADCEAGFAGYTWSFELGMPTVFLSEALPSETVVGGAATMILYSANAAQPLWDGALEPRIIYDIIAVGPDGWRIPVAGGEVFLETGPDATRSEYELEIPPTELPAGFRLDFSANWSGVYTTDMRLLYGGGDYADAGITFTLGSFDSTPGRAAAGGDEAVAAPSDLPATGGTPAWMLLGLVLLSVTLGTRRRLTSET
jgi:serine protease AprX